MTNMDVDIVARTLYGEARGEYKTTGLSAFIAIANVIANRVAHPFKYGKTYGDVCLKPSQFSCWNEGDPNRILIQKEDLDQDPLFKTAQWVAHNVIQGKWPDVTCGSDHYHGVSCLPSWAKAQKAQMRLGRHIFYKLDA